MPQPVSLMTTRTQPLSSREETVMVPPGLVYFNALSMMLTNTCRSLSTSPYTGGRAVVSS